MKKEHIKNIKEVFVFYNILRRILFLYDKKQKMKHNKLKKIQREQIPKGFFTLPNSIAEIWDNKKDDEWDKYL